MNKKTHFGFKEVQESEKSKFVGEVFTSVSENYDLMNDAMSFGMHRLWKKILVELAAVGEKDVILDIASGTGDIAKLISKEYPNTKIFMSDINYEMLDEGRNRAIDESFNSNCSFCQLSGESLPFKDSSFDLITVGFGLRNFTDKQKGLSEMKRCLSKNARLLVLEFSKPINPMFSRLYDWYSFNILPKLGSILANDSKSYNNYNQVDYAPTLMHEESLKFIERNKDNTFFLYYASPLPHLPLQAPEKWVNYYRKKIGDEEPYLGDKSYYPNQYPKATYAAMISYLDEQVGELIAKLKEIGKYENTLVIFTSDNGPVSYTHLTLPTKRIV